MADNHYKTLEVDPKATPEVINAAYRALAKLHRDDDVRMRVLNGAHDILKDDIKRRKHDRQISESVHKGKVIGEYRIKEQIAEGGFGTTYLAEHRITGKPVCIKHALHVSAHDEKILLDEARVCWDLRHWGIPAMRDIIRMPDDSLALVMSYVPGPTLAEILEMKKYNQGLDPEHVAWITDRTLNVLKYLHYNGVVHGDVKPQNLIIQPEDHTTVLVDYGLSKVKPSRKDGAAGYTPFFAAPEQEAGRPPLPESDFFGLGKTMIFALGGDVEFIKVPSDAPDGMCEFIKMLIKQDPLARPNWQDVDLCEHFRECRERDFGRTFSGMKKLDI